MVCLLLWFAFFLLWILFVYGEHFFYSKWETLQAPQYQSSAQQDVAVAKQAALVALCWPIAVTSAVGQCFGCSELARCSQCGHTGWFNIPTARATEDFQDLLLLWFAFFLLWFLFHFIASGRYCKPNIASFPASVSVSFIASGRHCKSHSFNVPRNRTCQ